jgi:hypothetical protein
MIQPEQMSLSAHSHIQKLLKNGTLTDEDVNAIYRLSQHLRVFGLLSAVGYMNQSANESEGKVRARVSEMWKPLLVQLWISEEELLKIKNENIQTEDKKSTVIELKDLMAIKSLDLMQKTIDYANHKPDIYMRQWRRSLELSQHWNFWARAYKAEKQAAE